MKFMKVVSLLVGSVAACGTAHAGVYYRAAPTVFVTPSPDPTGPSKPGTPASLSASPSPLSGLTVEPNSASTATLTVSNVGDLPTQAPPTVSIASGQLRIVSQTCSAGFLAGRSSCVAVVGATASANGPLTGSIAVAGMSGAVAVSGTASNFPIPPVVGSTTTPVTGPDGIVVRCDAWTGKRCDSAAMNVENRGWGFVVGDITTGAAFCSIMAGKTSSVVSNSYSSGSYATSYERVTSPGANRYETRYGYILAGVGAYAGGPLKSAVTCTN